MLTSTHQTSDAPDHQAAIHEFDGFTVSWEHRQFAGNNAEKGESGGCCFYGTEGTFRMGWQKGWTFYPVDPRKEVLHQDPTLHNPGQRNIKELWADFLEAIQTGRRPELMSLGWEATQPAGSSVSSSACFAPPGRNPD